MKAELANIPGRGLCIVISGFTDINDLIHNTTHLGDISLPTNSLITNPEAIALEIRNQRKISAIKELRAQTGWGLKETKSYIDDYYPMNRHDEPESYYRSCAERFMKAHRLPDFIDEKEFEI